MNRLAHERSPYLLQHAGNPVDWFAWQEEAFAKARAEDKPIFLSVGYSTCHWCHVMEHESFVDPVTADLLNRHFVSIKVDREERPDVDRVYMSFVQATVGSGGWPMSVFLTPDLKPFFGGTYFPPSSRWGKPGFPDVLRELARVWKDERARVDQAAGELFDRLRQVTNTDGRSRAEHQVAGPEALDEGVEQFQVAFDRRYGGFGGAPKFPRPSELIFLLREYARRSAGGRNAQAPLLMATETLRAMALGGMRDHVGGGFHRYSVDAEWRVPHFEKMLYDQAQLVLAYLEAAQATGEPFFSEVAEDTLAYVLRDMTDPQGGFYSAEDADSVPVEHAADPSAARTEGAFYIWADAELGDLLGDDAAIARRRFGIEAGGNAPHDPLGEFAGKNLLYVSESLEDIAARTGLDRASVSAALTRVREKLFAARSRRPRPHLDDKVLTAWNGLMIAAFARAARVLPDSRSRGAYLLAARRAAEFIESRLWKGTSRQLLRRYREGDAGIDGYAEDHAFLVFGLIELFQADGDLRWLEWARALQAEQDDKFWDAEEGGWFSTTGRDPAVLLRLKEEQDGAEPAASSISALNVMTLVHLIPDEAGRARAERTLARLGPRIGAAGRAVPMMLSALSTWHQGLAQIVIVGDPAAEQTRRLTHELASHYLPYSIVIPVTPGPAQESLSRVLDFVGAMSPGGGAAVYVCRDFSCQAPVSTPDALGPILVNPAGRG